MLPDHNEPIYTSPSIHLYEPIYKGIEIDRELGDARDTLGRNAGVTVSAGSPMAAILTPATSEP